jgi:putative membrane protein
MYLLVRLLITGCSLWAAVRLVPGISYGGTTASFLVLALIFGAVNALLRPLLLLLSLPLLLVTLGLFTFVVNGVMFLLASRIAGALGFPLHVAGFWPAFWGAIVVSVVSAALSLFVGKDKPSAETRR